MLDPKNDPVFYRWIWRFEAKNQVKKKSGWWIWGFGGKFGDFSVAEFVLTVVYSTRCTLG